MKRKITSLLFLCICVFTFNAQNVIYKEIQMAK